MNKSSMKLRATAIAIAAGMTLSTGAAGFVAPAFATVGVDANKVSENDSTITQTHGTLTIHKKANPGDTGTPTGEIDNSVLGTNLDGATFEITEITHSSLDAGTNEWLAAAQKLIGASSAEQIEAAGFGLAESSRVQTTANGGEAVFDNLPIGAYLVEETATPTRYLDAAGNVVDAPETDEELQAFKDAGGTIETFTPAAPFIAFVPMTSSNSADDPLTTADESSQGVKWNYDVHAYPKNYSKKKPHKTVKDVDEKGVYQNTGGTLEYDITTVVRNIAEGKRLSYYWIEDTLDAKNLKVSEAKVSVTAGSTPLVENTHYILDWAVDAEGNRTGNFRVKFTVDGLRELKSGTTVVTNVQAEKITDGPFVPNEAREYEPSKPESDMDVTDNTEPGEPTEDFGESDPVFSYFGGINFTKVNQGRTGLDGAEFQVFRSTNRDEDDNLTCDGVETENPVTATGTTENGQAVDSTFVSKTVDGKKGVVSIGGLHVNDFANNAIVAEKDRFVYCLVETKAPAGYELLAEPIMFSFVWNGTDTKNTTRDVTVWKEVTDAEGVTKRQTDTEQRTYKERVYAQPEIKVGANANEVVNLEDTTPQLPLTGGAGIGLLAGLGALIIGAGALLGRRNSKKA